MFKTRFISILALLCLTVSGAWAQQETLLTTILSTGDNASFKSGSKTFDNIATVTFSGDVGNDNDEYGWYFEEGTLTVTAAEGYTITRVKFYTEEGSAFDGAAPFEAILVYDIESEYFTKVNGTSIGSYGVTKIEVYGYAAPATVAVTGVTLAPTSATLTLGETETVTLIPTVLPDDATDKSVTWSSSNETVATVSNEGVVTAVAAGTATITVTTTDGAKTATCAVTVSPATYSVALKDGTDDATSWQGKAGEGNYQALPLTGLEAGTAVSVKYSGTKHVKSVKAKKKEAPATGTDLSMVDCAGNARDKQWTANCYMVHTAGDYKLPLVYGNAIKAGATNAAAYTGVENANTTLTFPRHDGEAITAPWIKDNGITVTTAELLWQDADGLITEVGISGDYLTLTVGKDASTQEGNALVAAKDGDGNVVWSWHIWVTKQTFAAADLTTVATGSHDYKVTPVNLGWVGDDIYTGTNTFYQWGRKDPFKGTGDVTFDGTTAATIADNIKNPMTFYNVSSNPSNTTYYNMWDAQQTGLDNIATATVKTVYDPSPAGFCVPTGNLYYYMKNGSGVSFGWDGTNKGRNLTSVTPNVFFPASGLRNGSSGSLGSVRSYGSYWSASANNGNYGRYLYFNSSLWYWYRNYRAGGFPVRAVAEE